MHMHAQKLVQSTISAAISYLSAVRFQSCRRADALMYMVELRELRRAYDFGVRFIR
jgi:RNase P/RNase MRP subunit p30